MAVPCWMGPAMRLSKKSLWPRVAAAGLSALYVGAFGLSHPLAKRIGAWPSVLAVTAVASGTAYLVSDADKE